MTVTPVSNDLYTPDPQLQQAAESTIAAFAASTVPPAWNFLDRDTILADIQARVADPFQVNQGGQPFCGPAAVLFELVRRQPQRYVELCQSLFTIGGFHSESQQWISASDQLRQASRGELHMGQADWMILATLRESENLLFPVEPNAPTWIRDLAGMTKSWELIGWIKEILGYQQATYHPAYLMNDLQALEAADQALKAGGVAFSLITAEALLENKPALPVPTHWISILGGIEVDNNQVSFDVYTWSKKLRISVDLGTFRQYFWLSVTALP